MNKTYLNVLVVFGYTVALGCLFYFLWITYENLQATSQDSKEFITSLELQQAAEAVFSDIRDIETGARGFVITGREDYLDPYYLGKNRINEDLQRLRKRFNVGESPQDNRSLFYLSLERMKR